MNKAKIAFTICSNNYLAKAKVVADSFCTHHKDYKFFIFLVDKWDKLLDYSIIRGAEIVEISKVVENIDELALQYNIIELNTAVKPAIFIYLFKSFESNLIIYLDPDLMIFDHFSEVEKLIEQDNQNIIITPHFGSPIDDGKYPSEIHFTPFGLYNLGFIAIKNSLVSISFLKWWNDRLMKYCYIRPEQGMFTDQLWINYAPLFFEGVCLLKHPGYNVANWNLYERYISVSEDNYYVNQFVLLKFFHFSHFVSDNPYQISKFQTRHSVDEIPALKKLIDRYVEELSLNNHEYFNKSKCFYHEQYILKANEHRKLKNKIARKLKGYLKKIGALKTPKLVS